jgi:hypothetical protein
VGRLDFLMMVMMTIRRNRYDFALFVEIYDYLPADSGEITIDV